MKDLYNSAFGRLLIKTIPALDIDSALCLAIENNDVKAVKKYLEKGAKIPKYLWDDKSERTTMPTYERVLENRIRHSTNDMLILMLQNGMEPINSEVNNIEYNEELLKAINRDKTDEAVVLIQHAPFEIKNAAELMITAIHNDNPTILKTLIETVKPTAEILDEPIQYYCTWTVVKAALQSHSEEMVKTVLEAYPLGQETPSWYRMTLNDIHEEYGRIYNHDGNLSQLEYDIKTNKINFQLKKGMAIWDSLQRRLARDNTSQTTNQVNATCVQPAKPIEHGNSRKVHTKA